MLWYRCPLCTHLLEAHELRVGKMCVCSACQSLHAVPNDRSAWLTESGEPIFPPSQAFAASEAGPDDIPDLSNLVVAGSTGKHMDSAGSVAPPPPDFRAGSPHKLPVRADFLDADSSGRTLALARRVVTPPPQPSPLAQTPADATSPAVIVSVESADAVRVRTQAEIAASLSSALARRMKPPRHPRRDLRLSTAVWLVLTGLGIAFFLITLTSGANYKKQVFGLGALEMLIGYGWIVWMTYHRRPQRGFACAVPPLTLYYLTQRKYAELRPLRFAITGALLASFAVLTPRLAPPIRHLLGRDARPVVSKPIEPAQLTSLEKLRSFSNQRAYEQLIALLLDLAKTDSLKSADAKDGPGLAAELKKLCANPDTTVKVAAMAAYARWGGDDARDVCLSFVHSQSEEERLTALRLLPQWKGTDEGMEVARAVASRIGRPGVESTLAEQSLVEIGGPAAERAALSLFLSAEDNKVRLIALLVLEKVGGNQAVTELREAAKKQVDPNLKSKTLETVDEILKRQQKKD